MRTIDRMRHALDARRVARDLRRGICPRAPRTFEMTIVLHPMWILDQHTAGIDVRAQFTTDDRHSVLRLKRLVIEVRDWSDETAVTAATLRAVRLGALGRSAERILGLRADYQPAQPPSHGRAPGRPRDTWTDEELARLAQKYAELVRKGNRRPYADLATTWQTPSGEFVSTNALRSAIKEARRRGLLEETTPGVPGGKLTADARKILRKAKR